MDIDAMSRRLGNHAGFIAALDQSGGSTPRTLAAYGMGPQRWTSEEEMFALIHAFRCRVLLSPAFDARRILAVILFPRTLDGKADGRPVPELLRAKGIVPFLKIDHGLEGERAGVQLMRPIEHLGVTLDGARAMGVLGTKARSLIHTADPSGIADAVAQQFELARAVLAAGMKPIVEPEVALDASHRVEAEAILRGELLHALDGLGDGQSVILKLTLPVVADLYRPLAEHPRVLRMAALSGGYSRSRACVELARNHAMIASFSRALLEGLQESMDDVAFDAALGRSVEEIYQASTVKFEPPPGSGIA